MSKEEMRLNAVSYGRRYMDDEKETSHRSAPNKITSYLPTTHPDINKTAQLTIHSGVFPRSKSGLTPATLIDLGFNGEGVLLAVVRDEAINSIEYYQQRGMGWIRSLDYGLSNTNALIWERFKYTDE